MKIWILVLGEPIKSDLGNPRMHRAGMLADYLLDSGHDVTFWTSNVDHFKKIKRCNKSREVNINKNYRIIELAGRLYKKNISLARILHNIEVARQFKKLSKTQEKPDVVITNYPIIELSEAAVTYCYENNIPSIVDVRDFWPDIFYETLPKGLSFIGNYIFYPWKRKAKTIVKYASAITGISDAAIKWARSKNNQDLQLVDKSFPLAYKRLLDFNFDHDFLSRNNLDKTKHHIYSFFGSLNSRIELDTLVLAAKILQKQANKKIRLVICGSGEMLDMLIQEQKKCSLIVLPGWIEKDQINTLLEVSKAGILPYPSSLDFSRSYPNKVGEYLSKGLPILSSVRGEMSSLLNKWECGITYENKNPQSLVDAINLVEEDEDYRKSMSFNAGECFRNKFDSDEVYKDYVNYITSFLGNKN